MEDNKTSVPYIVYESEAARHERTVKRLLEALLISILLMVATNLAWLYVWNQYDFSADGRSYANDGSDNFVRPDGSYRDGGMSYARGRGAGAKRDAMGRYSRAEDETIMQLEQLMDTAQDEHTRREIKKIIDRM